MKKVVLTVLLMTAIASGLPVSLILQDDVRVENNTVVHSITAFRDVQNVMVKDYFSEVSVKGTGINREEFLGREWTSVELNIGNMNPGEKKIIKYELLSGNGTALLGADTYYIDDEFHQLFPKEIEIDIKNRTDEKGGNPALFAVILICAIMLVIYIKTRKSRCS